MEMQITPSPEIVSDTYAKNESTFDATSWGGDRAMPLATPARDGYLHYDARRAGVPATAALIIRLKFWSEHARHHRWLFAFSTRHLSAT
ncbi:hypothetical protein LGN17_26980 [Burkholderia sp. AU30280]|uniref:hypothetical protein n=1 Tax=Burkholderia sp. AU30280 TaxID=2879628 RepID=UPI001CF54DE6|nr:hypothetical protein [Burkholderia sp. AU30280]MCA8276132.1 hypothetical protein [Burkholderia sp. AU30280]